MAAAKRGASAEAPDAGETVGTTEAAGILNVSPATLRRWVGEGRVPARKIGKQWRIKRSDLGSAVTLKDESQQPPATTVGPALQQAEAKVNALLAAGGMTAKEIAAAARGMEAGTERPAEGNPDARRLAFKLMLHAVRSHTSDLHIEPWADRLVVRQRVDGMLARTVDLPQSVGRPLLDEIMRFVALNPDDRRRPQDGRLWIEMDGREIDFRVSLWPGVHGPVAALRVLDRSVIALSLDRLGLEPEELAQYRAIIERPNGLVLVTGPTGHGITTRVYASLVHLNKPHRKIMTAEDPVEYLIEGVNQAAINEDIGFGFAAAARSMLRQDPDVVLIGELRDLETSELAVSAALTGHLVFANLHTNDAPSTVTRLVDKGVPPFRLASALQAIASQRLVRLVCKHCREEYAPGREMLDALELSSEQRGQTFHRGAGCTRCNGTGYRGRAAVSQLLEFTSAVRQAVFEGRSTQEIADAGRAGGFRTLREAALTKVFAGQTTLEEVIRVVA